MSIHVLNVNDYSHSRQPLGTGRLTTCFIPPLATARGMPWRCLVAPIYVIAVVGYGPTGLTAASLLGRLGYRVVVCGRWAGLNGLPRVTHIDDETARTLQAAADVDEALR